MRKVITFIMIFLLALATPVAAVPTVYLDGKQLTFGTQPITESGSTLVPLRTIFEAMGAVVTWDEATQTATAVKGSTTVILSIGSTSPTINGVIKPLTVPAKLVNGYTLAPLRFVGEAFGGTVSWEGATETITITTDSAGQIKVHFIDVGQADSIYIQLPGNNDILIDGGNVADGPAVVSYLKAQGVDDIELMIAARPHEDHIGGLPDVLAAFQVERILDSGEPATSKIYSTYSAAVKAEGAIYEADNYQTYNWGSAALQIYTGAETDVNDYSVICRLDTGDVEFLFTGDAETPVEKFLKGDVSAEILKVGHQGSASSTSADFLAKVKPEAAIISVGAGNTYGHPVPETVSRLQAAGIRVYRTDERGNIVVSTDGKTYSVVAQKSAAPVPAVTAPVLTPITTPPPQMVRAYVGSSKSDKYHLPGCRYATAIETANQVWFSTKTEAAGAGYVPCKVCKP